MIFSLQKYIFDKFKMKPDSPMAYTHFFLRRKVY